MKGAIVFQGLLSFFLHTATSHAQQPQSKNCPVLGPNFPAPLDIGSTNAIKAAQEAFPKLIANAMSTGLMDNQNTSFSISVFSATDNKTLYEQHFEAPGIADSLNAGRLDNKTVHRVGSISKLFTAYAILAKNGMKDFNQPITDYVPELNNHKYGGETDSVRWTDVTVGALASHMGGVARDWGLFDMLSRGTNASDLEKLGLPHLDASEIPSCGTPGVTTCSREQYVKGAAAQRPFTSTFHTPFYSNVGYVLLGYVLEKLTNKPYDKAVAEVLFKPLGLKDTYTTYPKDVKNTITPGLPRQHIFAVDSGALLAAGGLYSNLCDLKTFMLSIMHSSLLPKALTRQWMKPVTFTADPSISAGAPWEIFRVSTPLVPGSSTTRLSDVYSKAGDAGTYGSLVGISPDQNIGFVILAAGFKSAATRTLLGSLVAETWVSAAEAAAREEAASKLVGTYANTATNSMLTLSLNDNKPGLGVDYMYHGKPFSTLMAAAGLLKNPADIRLYPAGLRQGNTLAFKAAIEQLPYEAAVSRPPYHFGGCPTWLTSGAMMYGGVTLDDFEIVVDGEGRGTEVRVKGLRESLHRIGGMHVYGGHKGGR